MAKNTDLNIRIKGDSSSYTSQVFKATAANDALHKSVNGVSKGLITINGPLSGVTARFEAMRGIMTSGAAAWVGFGAAVAGASTLLLSSIRTASQYEQSQRKVEQIVRATGMAAGLTADQLMEQADQVALSTLASVEGIRDAQSVLLTFKSVQGETFNEAIRLSQDMAAVFGGSAKDKALQLGKALEDPVKGLNALSRSGVNFTESQRKVIRSLVETGDVAEAQRIILDRVAGQMGDAAVAQAQSLAGAYDTLTQRWDEFKLSLVNSTDADKAARSLLETLAAGLDRISNVINPDDEARFNKLFQERVQLKEKLLEIKNGETGFFSSLFGTDEVSTAGIEQRLKVIDKEMAEIQNRRKEALKEQTKAQIAAEEAASAAKEEARKKQHAQMVADAEKDLKQLRKTLADRKEVELQAYVDRQQAIYDIHAAGVITEEQRQALYAESYKEYQEKLTAIQKAELDQRAKDKEKSDENSYIQLMNSIGLSAEAERAAHEQRMDYLESSLAEGHITKQQYNDMETAMERIHGAKMLEIRMQAYGAVAGHAATALEAIGKENSKAYKIALAMQKAAAIPSIIVDTEKAAISSMALLPGPAGVAMANVVRGIGYASAGIVAGQTFAGAFENGGIVPGNSYTGDNLTAAVNSSEMILNRAQQRNLFDMANGKGSAGSGSNTTVQVINASSNSAIKEQQSTGPDGQTIKQFVIADLDADEEITQRLMSKFRLNPYGS